jgi:hypothetical protein
MPNSRRLSTIEGLSSTFNHQPEEEPFAMDDDLGEQERPLASPSKIPIPKARSTSDASATPTAVKPNINRAWVTVLTGPAYLPGTIILADSLRRVESKYPLLVCVTPSVNKTEQNALKAAGCELMVIEPLKPKVKVNVVATRFEDTWTKLVVFGLVPMEVSYNCFRFISLINRAFTEIGPTR